MKNILIVEGKTDKKFLESYIDYLCKTAPEKYYFLDDIDNDNDNIKDATGQDKIFSVLNAQRIFINKRETKNIGILIDADNDGIDKKIEEKINPAIQKAFGTENAIQFPNQKYPITYTENDRENTFNIFCHIFNLNGKGELEDILRKIRTNKTLQSPICLDKFVQCMGDFNIAYPEKEYKKNWVYFYGYESLKKEQLNIEEIKSKLKNNEYYTPKYWDFDNPLLNELKQFLDLFQ
ncbi:MULTISPECIES: DUF3226 domain-containing protein [Spirulina sp. CCY15215]|uniref:DUF3226 domain-containing protein n=1 Tax=Spirulina sp. CCY15215 TaxID=2767591 RepID=UPI00195214AB|nr:DUF3226 domain-containing protein [Spirulina major]